MESLYDFNLHFFCMKLSIFMNHLYFFLNPRLALFSSFPERSIATWLTVICEVLFQMHPNNKKSKFEKNVL